MKYGRPHSGEGVRPNLMHVNMPVIRSSPFDVVRVINVCIIIIIIIGKVVKPSFCVDFING